MRVICLGSPPAPTRLAADACLPVELADEEEADLLTHLPACVAFAAAAQHDGATLLVACHAGACFRCGTRAARANNTRTGVSRSAAVATAVLMASQALSADAALAALLAAHPGAAPNDGFVTQLRLFGDMGCRLREEHPPYRRFRVAQMAAAHAAGTAQVADAAALLAADPSAAAALGADAAGTVRCRKCRRLLALAEHVVAHERGAGLGAFDAHKRRKVGSAATQPCSSLFVEPLAWMGDAMGDGALEAKLSCPKCAGRLGSFCWAGEQCSCGAWVVPAFQLHHARVDVTQQR
jgi:dual specificity phosphatase 12